HDGIWFCRGPIWTFSAGDRRSANSCATSAAWTFHLGRHHAGLSRRGRKSVCCSEALAYGSAIGQRGANSLSFPAARGGCGAADGGAWPRHGRLPSLRAKSTNVIAVLIWAV